MYSLLIDTHDTKVSYVLYKNQELLTVKELESNMRHSEIAMPSLIEILNNNGVKSTDINEIIVNIGPGSFTGVRIGVVIAKTMAYLLNIPIKTINSLEMMAFSSEKINPGIYVSNEKNGYFVSDIKSDQMNNDEIKYYSLDEFEKKFADKQVFQNITLNYTNIYNHLKNRSSVNPHLVNPLYVKQIEALK